MDDNLGYYLMPHPPIIIPEIGKGDEKALQNTIDACRAVGMEISNLAPETIVIITPHGPVFSDAIALSHDAFISGSLQQFRAPNVLMDLEIDLELTDKIMELSDKEKIQTVGITKQMLKPYNRKYELDHGSIVPLYYVNQYYKKYKIVHITYGMLSFTELYQFGQLIKNAINQLNRKTVVIASGDLSHRLSNEGPYSYSPKGKVFDEKVLSYLENGEVLDIFNMDLKDIDEASECGYRSILILLGIMGKFNGIRLSYEGPFGVGYGVMRFEKTGSLNIMKKLKENEKKRLEKKLKHSDFYVKLARESLKYYFKHGKMMEVPKNLPEELINKRAGAFVSLKKHGNLRGCIGTFLPTTPTLAQEIIRNAIDAGFEDPRFSPLEEKELIDIDISVDILSEPEKASVVDLDPFIYGIIITQGKKRGLLLPNLEGINTVSEQIEVACQKAGINSNSHFDIERFKVERHIEGEL